MKSVIICDMEGLITNLNDGACQMFGYDSKELVGIKRVSIFSPDRNHIHHLLIDSGLSHKKASLLSGFTNLFFAIAMYLSIQYLGLVYSFVFLVVFILACFVLFFLITNNRENLRKKAKLKHIFQNIANFF